MPTPQTPPPSLERVLQQLHDSEINAGFVETLTARTLDRANMDEHVLAAAIRLDEAMRATPMT